MRHHKIGKSCSVTSSRKMCLSRTLLARWKERKLTTISAILVSSCLDFAMDENRFMRILLLRIIETEVALRPAGMTGNLTSFPAGFSRKFGSLDVSSPYRLWRMVAMITWPFHFNTKWSLSYQRHVAYCRRITNKQCVWRIASSGMLRRVALVRTDVSEERSASFIKVTRIGELGTTLAVTNNRRTLWRNTEERYL
jgi:hypothetical protein